MTTKAEIACETSGQDVDDHFAQTSDVVEIGKGGHREVEVVHFSRYACYLKRILKRIEGERQPSLFDAHETLDL